MNRKAGIISFVLCVLLAGCLIVLGLTCRSLLRQRKDLGSEVRVLKEANLVFASKVAELERKSDSLQTILLDVTVGKAAEMGRISESHNKLVKELKDEIARGEVNINEMKGRLTVNVLDRILFDLGKAEIKPSGRKLLNRIAPVLNQARNRDIEIQGHTDNLPIRGELQRKFPTNWELSTARATTVVRYLQEKCGVDAGRLTAAGYSYYRPIASNETKQGRQQNRRIEIVLKPKLP